MPKSTAQRVRELVAAGLLREEDYLEWVHLDPWPVVFLHVYALAVFYAIRGHLKRGRVLFMRLLTVFLVTYFPEVSDSFFRNP